MRNFYESIRHFYTSLVKEIWAEGPCYMEADASP